MIGSPTVLIHGKPAARWAPSGDLTACGAFLGDPRLAATRTVIIGNGVSVTTSLGLAVDLLVSLSPSLSSDVNSILKAGWTFSKGLPGKGSFARRDTKTIVIDPDDVNDTRTLVQTLAHEVGHARFVHPPYRPPSGLTREEYVRKNLENDLTDEGAANFSNARARGEITASGGPDIGIAGSQQERYQSIYDEYQAGRIDQPTAEQKMGALFGRGERTSTTNELYEDYYGKGYRKFWDTNLGNVPPGGKAP
jgi:type VI secretion system secreted protein VgrG